ncbi:MULTISPECIES: ABC transporter permease [Paenibacillus]|uniref:ABC-2 type transport system permease protein n=1 Tax=Paenibacillus pabuli TaxID=1472 RepID=A0A855Y094_9BACL|nr:MULTISPECIES: ABC transporter permease [Paenibacillus]PWW34690.1 ABC-2 type transport system permease protein [Paenibacillus pabuli]PXW01578.1 ABC-2 type transport system permease protein [Paenibacillus taichungensis]RAI88582.1 ABC-2 type transport system permease protein [Paenibacillus pabuli]
MKSLIDEWKYVSGSKYVRMIFIGPLIAAVFFGLMFSHNQINKSPVVVIDEDHSEYSRQLISKINASQYMSVKSVFASRMDPEILLANEQAVAVIMLPNQLGVRQQQGKSTNVGILMDNTMPSGLTGIRTAIQEIIQTENMTLSMTSLIHKGMDAEAAKGIVSPLSLQQRMLFNPTTSYVGFMVLGFVNIVVLMITTSAAGSIAPRLRQEGKLFANGRSPFQLWIRSVPYAVLSSISLLLSYGLLKQVGGMRFEAEPYLFIIPLVIYAFALSLLGMLIGYTAKDISKVSLRTSFVLYPSFLATGIQLTPLAFPVPFQIFAWALPMNWLNRLIRGMAFRDGALAAYSQELGALLIIIGVVSLFMGLLFLQETRKVSPSREHLLKADVVPSGS